MLVGQQGACAQVKERIAAELVSVKSSSASAGCLGKAAEIQDLPCEDQKGQAYNRRIILVHHTVQGEPAYFVIGRLSLEGADKEQDVFAALGDSARFLFIVCARLEHIAEDGRVSGEEEAIDGHFLVVRGDEDNDQSTLSGWR